MNQITHHLAQHCLGQHDSENQMRSPAKKKLRQANNHTTSSQRSNHDEQQPDTEQLPTDTQFLIWILLKYKLSVDRSSVKTLGIVLVATMTSKGTPTAPPPPNHQPRPPATFKPSGTTFDPAAWADAPPFLLQVPDRNERIAIRNANHKVYRSLGTNSMWHKYLRLGYYVFDDCMDFQRTWKSTAKEAISNRYKTIWKSLHIHRMNDLPISETLLHSAMNTARPYLQEKEPDFILATEIEYEEKNFFATSNLETADKNDDSGWTEVSSKKNKKKTPPQSPELTAQTPPTNDSMDPGFTIENMDISDEAMLGLVLARDTPLPSQEGPLPNTQNDQFLSESQPTCTQDGNITPIINPYSRQSKLRTSKIRQAILNSKNASLIDKNNNLVNPTNQSQPVIDLIDDTMTQATDKSNDNPTFTDTSSIDRSTYTQRDTTPINDGTLRITIRWKPENYDELTKDDSNWNIQITQMLKDIFTHPTTTISLVPWQDKTISSTRMVHSTSLTPDIVENLRSPKITTIDSLHMFIFAIRICVTDSTWITHDQIKEALKQHHAVLNISNSTCDSGNMVTAGNILLKHPQFTHRLYFLRAIRRCLPPNTPFFDIGVNQRSANGIQSPHLVVRCGENHQETLTEILSDFFDGIQTTALYIGSKVIESMTQEATEELFEMHQKYVNSIQRLPLSPHIVNIDRLRVEHPGVQGEKPYDRSTRAWANALKSDDGQSLQCDAENGGKDKKAYLLVPTPLLEQVQPMLQKYLQSIRTAKSSNSNPQSVTRDRPEEIYVPTASVQRNVNFLRNLSSASIWKNAPSTIRTNTKSAPQKTPTHSNPSKRDNDTQLEQINTPLRQGKSVNTTANLSDNYHTPNRNQTNANRENITTQQARQPDDTTIATFTSTASTTLNSSYQATRFAELETAIKANQQAFKNMNKNYETMENRVLETMEACHENSKQLITMQTQMNNMQTTMQAIADQMSILTDHITEHPNRSPAKKKQRQTAQRTNHDQTEGTTLNFELEQNSISDMSNRLIPTQADQEEVQYNETDFPDTAMDE